MLSAVSFFCKKWPSLLLVLLGSALSGKAQSVCNNPGQNPSTAFPVCGTSVFVQSSVNLCGGRAVPNPKCGNTNLTDVNPYWYKFTCFESGTLGLTITPNSATSDYDWQVFDITNRNANDVFSDASLTISSNWSQYFGETGTLASATNLLECGGPVPKYSQLPTITKGHTYLLLVSHFSNSQAGYRLEFKGGTAVITDTTRPQMKELTVGCGGKEFYLKLNKKMKCNSIAANGSDWEFYNSNVPIVSAVGVGCSGGGFETDSIVITAAFPVPPGTFALTSKKGTDGNTLLDLCDSPLPESQTLVVNVLPATPDTIAAIRPVGCAPTTLFVQMQQGITCSSIAANGSDFSIAGPAPVSISGAVADSCTGGFTKVIRLQLATPLQVAGTYTISVKTGTDGNTLINLCLKETPVGNSATVVGYDTVSARFTYTASSSCSADTVQFAHAGGNGISSWLWTEDGGPILGRQPTWQRLYVQPGSRSIGLTVSNGVCTASEATTFSTANVRVKAAFDYPGFACPTDTVVFTDRSTGPVATYRWDFGNGNRSTLQRPQAQQFASGSTVLSIPIKLVVTHANGCADSVVHRIQVPNNCYIAVPSGFTPNGDGLNDYLYPINAYKAKDLHFRVFNRYGQVVWETTDWTRKWDGRLQGQPLASGTYVWMLQYTDGDTGKRISQKGTTVLVR